MTIGALVLGTGVARSRMTAAAPPSTDRDLCRRAVHGPHRTEAIERLRGMGPAGLALLMGDAEVESARRELLDPATDELVRATIDRVAAQKDALSSGFYWYTDMDAARRAATASGKPILSLRLLGSLDEDRSCANGRFFRSVLYPDERVAALLRDRFVLHWKSVRPVPKLTIDFGDGRTLETTITGNSIHYVLAPDGTPIDAIPGLLGAETFIDELERADALSRELAGMTQDDRCARLASWHDERVRALVDESRTGRTYLALDGAGT